MPWRNFLSQEFGAKFQREVTLFLKVHEFPYNKSVYDRWKEAPMPKTSPIRSAVLVELLLVTDRRIEGHG